VKFSSSAFTPQIIVRLLEGQFLQFKVACHRVPCFHRLCRKHLHLCNHSLRRNNLLNKISSLSRKLNSLRLMVMHLHQIKHHLINSRQQIKPPAKDGASADAPDGETAAQPKQAANDPAAHLHLLLHQHHVRQQAMHLLLLQLQRQHRSLHQRIMQHLHQLHLQHQRKWR
jgi:hypothetical protein